MIIGVDVDDVIYPWYKQAHALFHRDGYANGIEMPTSWYPYLEYGIERDEWREQLGEYTEDGSLFLGAKPMEGSQEAFDLIHALGHEIHVVTTRGGLPKGRTAQAQTIVWLAANGYEYEHLTFTKDKGSVGHLDYMVDDVVENLIATARNGKTKGVLVSQSWNMDANVTLRVPSLLDFAKILLATDETYRQKQDPAWAPGTYPGVAHTYSDEVKEQMGMKIDG